MINQNPNNSPKLMSMLEVEFKLEKVKQTVEYKYRIEERNINGKIIKVKVYESHADKRLEGWRDKREAASTHKGKK